MTLPTKDDLNIIEYLYYYNGGGVAVGDINNDGLEDVYFTANQSPDRLYLNLGGLKFKDITKTAGINIDSTWSSGVTMEDVNNDGFWISMFPKSGNTKAQGTQPTLSQQGQQRFEEYQKRLVLLFPGFRPKPPFSTMTKMAIWICI